MLEESEGRRKRELDVMQNIPELNQKTGWSTSSGRVGSNLELALVDILCNKAMSKKDIRKLIIQIMNTM